MASETAISAILTASIAGAGLIVAIYALISPISTKIFRERVELLRKRKRQFDQMKEKISPESSDKEFKVLKTLATKIKDIKSFPKYLGIGVFLVFLGYIFTALLALNELSVTSPQNVLMENVLFLSFYISTIGFMVVGFYAIFDVAGALIKEFQRLKEETEEVMGASESQDLNERT